MVFAGMSYVVILAAAAAAFMFGGAYYGILSKPWMAAVGKTPDDLQQTGMALPLAITAVSLIVMAWVLAGIMGHLGAGPFTIRNGLITGAFCWLGFVITTVATNHAYQGAKPMLTILDSGYWLGVLLIEGAIIGAFGSR